MHTVPKTLFRAGLALGLSAALAACLPSYDPSETPFNGGGNGGPVPGCDEPTAEVCDGEDNDCDGVIDEDFPRRGLPCGNNIGICAGVTLCEAGVEQCVQIQEPEEEACDGLDNNCDGQIDELTDDDPTNCGGCGIVCEVAGGAAGCRQGVCTVESCDEGFLDCDRDPDNGCETDITSDPTNCGACANICSAEFAETVCTGGQCVIEACLGDRNDCNSSPLDGCEADLAVDTLNCGACGTVCDFDNAQSTCTENACVFEACLNGFGDRDANPVNGCEIGLDLLSSPPDAQLDSLSVSGSMLFGAASERLVGYPLDGSGAIGALAFTKTLANPITKVDSDGTTVFAALSEGDIQILSATPAGADPIGLVTTSGPSPGFVRDGDTLYVADGRDGLRIIDVSTPSEPVQLSRAPTPDTVGLAHISGDRLLLNAPGRNEFYLFDVADPRLPTQLGTFTVQAPFDRVVLSGDLMITGLSGSSRIQLYRQDLTQLTFLGEASLPGGLSGLELRFPFLVAVVRGQGDRTSIVLVDIRRPQQPAISVGLDARVANAARSAVVANEQIYVAGSAGLERFGITDLRSPVSLQDVVRPQNLRDVAVQPNRLFVADNGSVEILDNSNPEAPIRLARIGTQLRTIHPTETSLFATTDNNTVVGYRTLDVNDDTMPFIVIDTPRPSALESDPTGNILYMLRGSILETVNVGGDPALRGTLELPSSCRDMVRHQTVLYLACTTGVIVVDPGAPPTNPVIIGQPGGGDLFALDLFGQSLYGVTTSGVAVFTALTPGDVSSVGTIELEAQSLRHIVGAGSYMVVTQGNEMILLDRSALTTPEAVATRTLEGGVVKLAATPNTFYSGTSQGVFRLDVTAP